MNIKEEISINQVIYLSIIYKKEKSDIFRKLKLKWIDEGLFYQSVRSGPKKIDGMKVDLNYIHEILLIDNQFLNELKLFCQDNNIEIN